MNRLRIGTVLLISTLLGLQVIHEDRDSLSEVERPAQTDDDRSQALAVSPGQPALGETIERIIWKLRLDYPSQPL